MLYVQYYYLSIKLDCVMLWFNNNTNSGPLPLSSINLISPHFVSYYSNSL